MLFKDPWPCRISPLFPCPICIRALLQTGWNSTFSTSTMARTRIGLKLNHTQMVRNEEIFSEACWSIGICYLEGTLECWCSCLGWRDAARARQVPGLHPDQDLGVWVRSLWDAGQAVKDHAQLSVEVPKVGEMDLSWSLKIPIQTFCLAAAKPWCLGGFYFIFTFKLPT